MKTTGLRKHAIRLLLTTLLCVPGNGQQPQAPEPTKSKTRTVSPLSQEPPPPPEQNDTIRITTNLVQIDAVVTKGNKAVTDLTAEDFEIFEDGKRRTITNFSFIWNAPRTAEVTLKRDVAGKDKNAPEAPPPPIKPGEPHRTIAIVVDDLGISMESVGSVRKQLRRFVDEQMQANDLVAIVRTGGEVGALQQFTNDKRLLRKAVENLKWHPCSRAGVSIFPPQSTSVFADLSGGSALCSFGNQTKTLESLRLILHGLAQLTGRKSLVVLSEHFSPDKVGDELPGPLISPVVPTRDTDREARARSPEFYDARMVKRIAELAIRSSVVIYTVDTRGLVPLGPTAADHPNPQLRPASDQPFGLIASQRRSLHDSRTDMDYLSRETGGLFVRNSNDFGLKRISDDQSGYYLIGYRPTDETFDRRFHHITVKVKKSGLNVLTRSGFYGMADEDVRPLQLTERDRINMALMSPFRASNIEVHLTALFANVPTVGSVVRSLIHFSGAELKFTEQADGVRQATLNLAAVVFGDNGAVVQQMSETREIRLKQSEFERVVRDGMIYQMDMIIAKPGTYQFRIAVRDEGSSLIGTARELVNVPELRKDQVTLSGLTLSGDNAEGAATSEVISVVNPSGPAIRRFRRGANLWFGYSVYNAQVDSATSLPALSAQARIFRDGQVVYAGELQQIDASGQVDLSRVATAGGLRLGSSLEPGKYQLQIVVTDSARPKRRTAAQWIDFEIVE